MKLGTLVAQTFFAPLVALAQERIVTDRPDFTEAATVVGKGRFQVEAGVTAERSVNGAALGFPELLFRGGVSESVELRLGAPDYAISTEDHRTSRGFGDVYLGAKVALGPLSNGDELALIPAVNIPSSDGGSSSGSADPELKVSWSRDLDDRWGLGIMGYGLLTTDEERIGRYQQTASFAREIGEMSGCFFEYAGTFTEGDGPDHIFHTGLAHALDDDVQVDVHGGFFLNGSHQRPFLGLGFAARF